MHGSYHHSSSVGDSEGWQLVLLVSLVTTSPKDKAGYIYIYIFFPNAYIFMGETICDSFIYTLWKKIRRVLQAFPVQVHVYQL